MYSTRRLRKAKRRRHAAGLAALALFALATTAGADGEAGSGAGTGRETKILTEPADPAPNPPLCLRVKQSEYEVAAKGTITANNTGIVYASENPPGTGGTDIIISWITREDYFIAPEGTYGNRLGPPTNACDPDTYGARDPVKVDVIVYSAGDASSGVGTGADGVASASRKCEAPNFGGTQATGGYSRENSTITLTWRANCAVDGNVPDRDGAAVESNTQFVFVGNLNPVTGEVQGSYSQS